MSNAQGIYLDIFPISVDRTDEGTATLYVRIDGYETMNGFSTLNEGDKYFLADTEYASSIPASLSSFYKSEERDVPGYNGRILSEQNISSIISKLTNDRDYVIDKGADFIEFMIKGHYFKLSDPAILTGATKLLPLYVGVTFTNTGNDFEYLKINVEDNKITSIDFYNNEEDSKSNHLYWLQLLDDSGNIPIDSKFRFNGDVIRNIDGGTV